MKSGVDIIAIERIRQVSKYGPDHDDAHHCGELARAAACYAMPAQFRLCIDGIPTHWPFDNEYWKPSGKSRNGTADYIEPSPIGRIRELAKAGALIAAEIDRIIREERGVM